MIAQGAVELSGRPDFRPLSCLFGTFLQGSTWRGNSFFRLFILRRVVVLLGPEAISATLYVHQLCVLDGSWMSFVFRFSPHPTSASSRWLAKTKSWRGFELPAPALKSSASYLFSCFWRASSSFCLSSLSRSRAAVSFAFCASKSRRRSCIFAISCLSPC